MPWKWLSCTLCSTSPRWRDKTGAETIVLNVFKLLSHTTQITFFVPYGGYGALARLFAQEQGPHADRITPDRFCTEMGQD